MKRQLIAVALIVGLAGAALGGGLPRAGTSEPVADGRSGVTSEPCPNAVDRAKGCIYLGFITDLRSVRARPRRSRSPRRSSRFWDRVNRAGGIGGHEIDAVTYVRDNHGDWRAHARAYREIRGKVLALGQTMGGRRRPRSVIDLMRADDMVAVPASWTSAWAFEPDHARVRRQLLRGGGQRGRLRAHDRHGPVGACRSTCPATTATTTRPGSRRPPSPNGMTFINVKTDPGADRQSGAVDAILARRPDLVVLADHPAETAVIVQGAAAGGFTAAGSSAPGRVGTRRCCAGPPRRR